jgi:hypothetical protein
MPKAHGTKKDGTPITDEMIGAMADEAERGYDVEEILYRRPGGRPPMGSAPPQSSLCALIQNSSVISCFELPMKQ